MLIFLGDSVVAEDEQAVPAPLAVAHQMEDAAASQPLQHCTPDLFHHGGKNVGRSILAAPVTWPIKALPPRARTGGNRSQTGMHVCLPSRRFAVNKDSLPDLQVQQPPDPIAVIATASTVVGEQSPDRVFFEQSTLQCAPLCQLTFQVIQLRPRQPVSPRSGEPHLLPV